MAEETKYKPLKQYKKQGGTRTVKHLLFPVHTSQPHALRPGEKVPKEKLFRRGQEIPAEFLDDYNLERGERLDAFYTDAELTLQTEPEEEEGGGEPAPAFNEMGETELAEYIRDNKPTIDQTVAMAGNDKDTARRLLEAEHIATGGDPRKGVVEGLNAIVEEG